MDDETGEFLWYEIWAGPEGWDEAILDMAIDGDGNIYTVGRKFGIEYYDIIVQKWHFDTGYIYWTEFVQGEEVLDDIGLGVAIDSQGHPVITGIVGRLNGLSDYTTVKFDKNDGSVIWRVDHPGAVFNIEARTSWLAVMDDDDVVMGSRTWTPEGGYDIVVHRYDSADGGTVWANQWNSGGNVADDPHHMIRDAAGDIYFAGTQAGDYLIAKFSQVDGELIWQTGYTGPPDWYDVATELEVAADGTIVVTGFSDGDGTGWDIATLGLEPVGGARLWETRHDGFGYSDEPRDLACSPSGDVYVTGYAYGTEFGNDMVTVRYGEPGAVAVDDGVLPSLAGLTGAWPNPFNPRVNLSFALRAAGPARLAVHDLLGREVAVLHDGALAAGEHRRAWDGRDRDGRAVPAGVYLATLVTGEGRSSRKLVLAK